MRKLRSIVVLVAAVLGTSLAAVAQFQVNNGNVSDANTQAGSGGSNSYSPRYNNGVTGNQIVNGDVTGGRALQTNTGYFGPNQLETQTGTEAFQQFVRDSTGVPTPYQSFQPSYLGAQPYYSGPTTTNPPPGYVRNDVTGAYVPSSPVQPQMGYDTRLNLMTPGGISPSATGLTPFQTFLPPSSLAPGADVYGPDASVYSAQLQTTSPFFSNYRQWTPQELQALSQSSIAQMRSEVSQSASESTNTVNTPPGVTPSSVSPLSLNPTPVGTPPEQSTGVQMANNAAVSSQSGEQPAVNGAAPQLVTPAQQSSEYAQLQQRLSQYQSLETSRLSQELQQSASEKSAHPGETPAEEKARLQANLYPPSVPHQAPLAIHSLAAGIHAQGLRNLMADAEESMRQGHFAESMIRYAAAEEVAPNNPLIALGRSFAELGAGYYARSAHDLRLAIGASPALLMGQYDLKSFLGQERIEYLVHDLKQIANKDKSNVDAPLLLAYIAYNTGSPSAAEGYLKLAEQRSSANDPYIALLRRYWDLSQKSEQ
ncbi:MAG TPA: hypothetical protein VG722_05460 [Tepidisphaeraceae bacterium]|nr:hypothetical protein [Tepidisphaeraceae bacterium]